MSKEIKIFRDKAKSRKLLIGFVATCLFLSILFIYGLGIFDNVFKTKVIVTSGGAFLIMLFVLIKSLINMNDKSAIFEFNENTVIGRTSPLSKAIGEINWKDVTGIEIQKSSGDTFVVVYLSNVEYYKSKLSKIFWNMAFDKESQELYIMYSASEIDMKINELHDLFLSYWKQ